jgi:hypothetical protein
MILNNRVHPQIRFDAALERVLSHVNRPSLSHRQAYHLRQWTGALAHAVFHMHPELREDGSFLRYFVARQARRQGLRGAAVTAFVDDKFRDGIPPDYFPEWFIKGEFKHPWE